VARRVQIIVTPGSGEGRTLVTAQHLHRLLRQRGDVSDIRTYESLAALRHWAQICARDFTSLVCVGGDATQSAAAIAAMRLDVPFVPVPNGFGNIFGRVFEHPSDPEAVVNLLDEGEPQRVDVGMLNGSEVFLSHHSYGMLQQVQEMVERPGEQPKSRGARYLAYYVTARRLIVEAQPPCLRVEVDDTLVAEGAGLVTVANVETYRGYLSLTPTASPLDGKFDVFIAPRTSHRRLVARLLGLMLGLSWKGVQRLRGRRVVVTDGDRREVLQTVSGVLPLIVPPGSAARLDRRAGGVSVTDERRAERPGWCARAS